MSDRIVTNNKDINITKSDCSDEDNNGNRDNYDKTFNNGENIGG